MNQNIHLLGDKFKTDILASKKEYDDVFRSIYRKRAIAFHILNDEKRIKEIIKIREDKINELNAEIKKSELELADMKNKVQNSLSSYCKSNGHDFCLIQNKFLGLTGRHSFALGSERLIESTYKCKVCGQKRIITSTYYSAGKQYTQLIPEGVYTEAWYEKHELEEYIKYLRYLKRYICYLFGHKHSEDDPIMPYHTCTCCETSLPTSSFSLTPLYGGIIDYTPYSSYSYIRFSSDELVFQLPSFDDYKEMIRLEKEKNKDNEEDIELEESEIPAAYRGNPWKEYEEAKKEGVAENSPKMLRIKKRMKDKEWDFWK